MEKKNNHFTLRPWVETDLDSLVKHADNFNVARYLTDAFPYPYTRESGIAYLQLIANDTPTKVFAIDINGEAVGSIGIFPQADIHAKSAEIGYWLSESCWGRGIMPAAVRQIADYGFRTFDIVRIYARPFSINKGSQRVLEKAGFTHEATLKKALVKLGEVMDEHIYALWKEND